jgi:hypothetical protein
MGGPHTAHDLYFFAPGCRAANRADLCTNGSLPHHGSYANDSHLDHPLVNDFFHELPGVARTKLIDLHGSLPDTDAAGVMKAKTEPEVFESNIRAVADRSDDGTAGSIAHA